MVMYFVEFKYIYLVYSIIAWQLIIGNVSAMELDKMLIISPT